MPQVSEILRRADSASSVTHGDSSAEASAKADLTLSSRRIDLWFVFYEALVDSPLLHVYRTLLNESERQQERRYQLVHDRVRYLVTRALVRTVLSRYVPLRPECWRFGINAAGKPVAVNGPVEASDISFNLSHTDSAIALAVTRRSPLGIDIENVRVRAALVDVADGFFGPEETAALEGASLESRQHRYFEFWTLKEAYLKARGVALAVTDDRLSFGDDSLEDGAIDDAHDQEPHWRFWQLSPTPEYLVSLSVGCLHGGAMQTLVARDAIPLVTERPLEYVLTRYSD